MFKIIKKGGGNFWHNFNNGSKEVNLSDWEIVLDSVNQTVSLQMLNGANVPQTSVIISDIVVIDETDGSVEETFTNITDLRNRLIELNYTPYIILNGFVPEAPIDGLTYGRKDAEWVEVSGGGGSTPDATTTVKGKLKLAGDLAGTADLPTVPALALKQDTLTDVNFGSFINSLPAKNTLVDADEVVSDDSADSNKAKKTSWINVWTNYLKPKADALYQAILTDANFGSFSTSLTSKTTPVDADSVNIVDSADSNKAKKVSLTNFKAFLKTYFDGQYSVPCITITTSVSIDTDTTSSSYGQHGRNTKIANSTNAINLTVQTSSNADFVASYTKIGSATITFVAGSGATLVQLSGTAALTGSVGSTACLTRNGNTYYLQITNY